MAMIHRENIIGLYRVKQTFKNPQEYVILHYAPGSVHPYITHRANPITQEKEGWILFWGRYFLTEKEAREDFLERAGLVDPVIIEQDEDEREVEEI